MGSAFPRKLTRGPSESSVESLQKLLRHDWLRQDRRSAQSAHTLLTLGVYATAEDDDRDFGCARHGLELPQGLLARSARHVYIEHDCVDWRSPLGLHQRLNRVEGSERLVPFCPKKTDNQS